MQAKLKVLVAAMALLTAAGASYAGGVVNVTFVEPDKFYDAANTKNEIPATLQVLEQHLQKLGQRYLADGQVLDITVTGVDLAGYMRPTRSGEEIRVARGTADWPRITLRYDLSASGQSVKKGEEVVADLNYGRHGPSYGTHDPLRHEKRMLDGWFRSRFSAEP